MGKRGSSRGRKAPEEKTARSASRTKTPRRYERETKRRGELAELAFAHKAASLGFAVLKPYGDSERYDLAIDAGHRLWRVQVKSAHRVCAQAGGGYHIRAHGHQRKPYRADEIDLLVAYIVPENIWYVFPPSAFQNMKSMRLFPQRGKKTSKFEPFREAWSLLRETKQL